jgi:hypothetical protein
VADTLRDLKRVRIDTLLKRRYEKIRNWGSFFETLSSRKAGGRSKKSGSPSKNKSTGGNGSASRGAGKVETPPAEALAAGAENGKPTKGMR